MSNENGKRKYGHGKDRKDSKAVMRIDQTTDDRLNDLTKYLGKTRSDVMRDALNMLYESEGGDEIRNKPPKNSNAYFSLSDADLNTLYALSNYTGDSQSEVIRKALGLFKLYKELD